MKIALAQINTSMGAIDANCARIASALAEASKKGADLTVFPELVVVGYAPKDLLEEEGFLARVRRALDRLGTSHPKQDFLVGFVDENPQPGKGRFNSAAYVSKGKVAYVAHKRLLPTYDVFDEARYFDRGAPSEPVSIGGTKFGLTICEDIWTDMVLRGRRLYDENPGKELKKKGAEVLLNLSASPYSAGRETERMDIFSKYVREVGLPLVYVNLVGGNDELLFDGASFVLDANGKLLARAAPFREDVIVVDLASKQGEIRDWSSDPAEWMASALVMGVRDYVKKCGFTKVLVGLSGGIDSSLVALLAVEALGAENVTGVSMPSRFTSEMSRQDAEALVRKLKIEFVTIPIEEAMQAYDHTLADVFAGKPRDTTEENIQARIRGNILMALSNKFGALVLSTGNKSELSVGYCTQYGDLAGGLAAISDLPKGDVYRVARFLNQKLSAIPERVFTRPPSAELRPDQKDEDSIPSYDLLDPILKLYVEEMLSPETIVAKGYPKEVVERVAALVDRNEFKRRQAPPGLRVTTKAFGSGRRMPIARGSA